MSSDLPVMSTYHLKNLVSIWQRSLRVNIAGCPSDGGVLRKKEKEFNSDIVI